MPKPKHPHLRHEAFMKYLMQREDLVNECSEKLLPFVNKYDCRIDCLVDEIEAILTERTTHEDTVD